MWIVGAVIGFILLPSVLLARDLLVPEFQQQALLVICEKAARSPAATIDEVANIAQFCINFRKSIMQNNAVPDHPSQTDPGQQPRN